MTDKEKEKYIKSLFKKGADGKPYLSLGDMYDIYDKCKVKALIKIVNSESEVYFNDEDYETDDPSTEEGDTKISD